TAISDASAKALSPLQRRPANSVNSANTPASAAKVVEAFKASKNTRRIAGITRCHAILPPENLALGGHFRNRTMIASSAAGFSAVSRICSQRRDSDLRQLGIDIARQKLNPTVVAGTYPIPPLLQPGRFQQRNIIGGLRIRDGD